MSNMAKSRYDTWITGGKRWMRTYVKADQGEEQLADCKRRLLDVFGVRESKKDHTRATARAEDLGFSQSSPWMEIEGLHPETV